LAVKQSPAVLKIASGKSKSALAMTLFKYKKEIIGESGLIGLVQMCWAMKRL